MRALSLREKIAQLVVAPFYGENPPSRSRAGRQFDRLVRKVRVGGLVIINLMPGGGIRPADPRDMAAFLNRMQRRAKIPLLVAGDFERGTSMRVTRSTRFPHAMAYGAAADYAATRFLGAETARQARALGVHWVLAPVADVNVNPDNPVINIRSFGEDPEEVSRHVKAFIEGARAETVLVTAKHFPGHGDTAVDSHLDLPRLDAGLERLQKVELAPFRAAIAAGVDCVMAAHIAVAALDPSGAPATVSRPILTNLLQEQLGFHGLVSTDAMDMRGLSKQFEPGEAAVRALEAGADILLMPPNPEVAIRAIEMAIRKKRLSRARIEQSVRKILSAKVRVGLAAKRTVDLNKAVSAMETPESQAQAQHVADRAVALIKGRAPLRDPSSACYTVLGTGEQGEEFTRQVRSRAPQAIVTTGSAPSPNCSQIVVAAFATSSRTSAVIPPGFIEQISKPFTIVALGNPSLLRDFNGAGNMLATFSTVPASETAAVKVLFGEIRPSGRAPVTIPGITSRKP